MLSLKRKHQFKAMSDIAEMHAEGYQIWQLNLQGMASWLRANKTFEQIVSICEFGVWVYVNEDSHWSDDETIDRTVNILSKKEQGLSPKQWIVLHLFAAETCFQAAEEYGNDYSLEKTYEEVCKETRSQWMLYADGNPTTFRAQCTYAVITLLIP